MSAKKGDYQIPFDGAGNQLHYPESWKEMVWRDNTPFETTLTYDGYSRGRSAAYLGFKTTEGKGVTVFMTDFEAMVPRMVKGEVTGTFRFTKRGQNYGCQLVEES